MNFSRMIKHLIRNILAKSGYAIKGIKYTPIQFVEDSNVLKINFDNVIFTHLAKMDPSEFFFIQVGAFDGLECDPLYKHIIRYGWNGVMLEPQSLAYDKLYKLHKERSNITLINAAISDKNGKTRFYILEGDDLPEWSKGMASFNKENILKHDNIIPNIDAHIRETEIDCISFSELFTRFPVKKVDLLQVDTEGFDAEVIKMFPFEEMKPTIIHFECKHLSKKVLEELLSKLVTMNYRVAYDGEEDILAVQNN